MSDNQAKFLTCPVCNNFYETNDILKTFDKDSVIITITCKSCGFSFETKAEKAAHWQHIKEFHDNYVADEPPSNIPSSSVDKILSSIRHFYNPMAEKN